MEIPAVVDLSALSSPEEIKEYADKYYEEIIENRSRVTTCVCIVKGKINEKLQERREPAYEAIAAYAEGDEFASAAEYDYELRCFKTASNIYQLERGFETTVFDTIEYVDSFCKIYEETVNYFMRIQLGFTKALCMECMAFFRRNKLSVFAIVQMLVESGMGEKEKIALALSSYYVEQGLYKEAKYIVSVFEEQGREAFKQTFTEKKEEISSMIG